MHKLHVDCVYIYMNCMYVFVCLYVYPDHSKRYLGSWGHFWCASLMIQAWSWQCWLGHVEPQVDFRALYVQGKWYHLSYLS